MAMQNLGSPMQLGFPISNYTMSLALLERIDFWDTTEDAIGEDFHMFVKAYFKTNGQVLSCSTVQHIGSFSFPCEGHHCVMYNLNQEHHPRDHESESLQSMFLILSIVYKTMLKLVPGVVIFVFAVSRKTRLSLLKVPITGSCVCHGSAHAGPAGGHPIACQHAESASWRVLGDNSSAYGAS